MDGPVFPPVVGKPAPSLGRLGGGNCGLARKQIAEKAPAPKKQWGLW